MPACPGHTNLLVNRLSTDPETQGAWLRLQMFLVIQGGTDVRAAYSSQRLQQLCQEKLVKLQGQSDNTE